MNEKIENYVTRTSYITMVVVFGIGLFYNIFHDSIFMNDSSIHLKKINDKTEVTESRTRQTLETLRSIFFK